MADYGCNFRVYQAVAEFTVETALTADQIQAAVTTLQNTSDPAHPGKMVLGNDLYVNNPDLVINDTFDRLGQPNMTGTVGWGAEPGQQSDYQVDRGTTTAGTTHSKLLDSSGTMIYDPNDPELQTTTIRTYDVYLHDE
jgi:hypothetical protein